MQFQSDILQMKIERPSNIESTALGVGMLAGIGAGFWSNPADLTSVTKPDQIFTPLMDYKKRNVLLQNWQKAIKRACYA